MEANNYAESRKRFWNVFLRTGAINNRNLTGTQQNPMAQTKVANLDMEEMDELEFISQLAELTKLCGIFKKDPIASGEAKALKPAKLTQIKLTSTFSPPKRYTRPDKAEVTKDNHSL